MNAKTLLRIVEHSCRIREQRSRLQDPYEDGVGRDGSNGWWQGGTKEEMNWA